MQDNEKPVLGMVLKGYPRISETFISNEILLLEQLGFSIHIFSMRHPREPFSHKSVKSIKARVDYLPHTILSGLPLFMYHNILLAMKQPSRYAGAIRVAFRRFMRTRKSATFKHLLQAGLVVHRFMRVKNIVHLHAHFAHSPTSVAMFASQLSGLDFSFTGHAKDIYTSDPRQLKEKILLARFVCTCTEYNKVYLEKIGGGTTHVHRVYHGIDLKLFKGRDETAEPKVPYQIITIARMVPKKGLPTVYHALKILKEQGMNFRHTLVGDGDDREKTLALIKELDLDDRCRWLGTLTHEEVLDHYRGSDVFVLGCEVAPTGDRDGIPNVFVESMAMGVPVVSTHISAIPELITHEETGLLVPPKSPEMLAGAVERILQDKDLRKKMIPAAKIKVKEVFDNKKLIKTLADIYLKEQPILKF